MPSNKVLIVEDNPMNMELTADLLEINDYSVLQATTAEEGINIAKTESPDLILMDIGLPGMDGLAATKILKNNEKTKKITIIALTSHAMIGDDETVRKAGCDGYITKPIVIKEFLQKIAQYFPSSSSI